MYLDCMAKCMNIYKTLFTYVVFFMFQILINSCVLGPGIFHEFLTIQEFYMRKIYGNWDRKPISPTNDTKLGIDFYKNLQVLFGLLPCVTGKIQV